MKNVVHVRKAEYRYQVLRPMIFEMLSSEGGPAIEANTRVLLKPNFLAPATPDKAMTTHPLILRAVAEFILERGATVQISDSPAAGGFTKLVKNGGYEDALADLDVSIKPFWETLPVDIGEPFGAIEVAKDAMEADVMINLAKLKTHAQMRMTLGVKNCFGCIVGFTKAEWHMRTGVDREMFARLIVRICEAVNPDYTVIDGILAMEGQGPARSGTPRPLGVLLGGSNPHAVDHAACLQVGLDPKELETQRVAGKVGIYDGSLEPDGRIRPVHGFSFPERVSLSTGPPVLDRFMRKFVIQRPSVDENICRLCGECWKICPANAISHTQKELLFNTKTCIRCYCCLEVCPFGAIRARKPLAGKVISRLSQKFENLL